MIHFLRPEWFIALLPLSLLLWLLIKYQRSHAQWQTYIAPHLAKLLVNQKGEIKKQRISAIAISGIIAIIALSGPALMKQSLPVYEDTQGRVLVLDMSLSMYANDLPPNRATIAKFKASDLLNELTIGETGLIAYAGDAFVISPLTRDTATLLNLLPTLTPEIMPVRGSNLPAALEKAKQLLAQGGHINGDIVLLTDGVRRSELNQAKAVLNKTQYRLGILALGTTQGSPIKLPNGQLLRDSSDQVVVAKTQFNLLNELAYEAQGIVVPYRADGDDLLKLKQWIEHLDSNDTRLSEREGEIWQDLGPYIALLLLLPALLSFRTGLLSLLLCFTLLPAPDVLADTGSESSDSTLKNSWNRLWNTSDQLGMQSYNEQKFNQAAQEFDDPQWRASAHYRAKNYPEALSLYEQDNSAHGLYNQGNTLMQQGEYQEAISRYQQAEKQYQTEFNQAFNNAIANRELAQKLLQQQQSENSNGSDGADDKESSEQQNDNSQSSQNQKDNNQTNSNSPAQEKSENSGEQNADSNDDSLNQDKQQTPQQESSSQAQTEPSASEKEPSASEKEPSASEKEPSASEKEPSASDSSSNTSKTTDSDQTEPEQSKHELTHEQQNPKPLSPDLERALKAVNDDPQLLLRNKMQLEYQKRRAQGYNTGDNQQW